MTDTMTNTLQGKLKALRARRPKMNTPEYRVWLRELRTMLNTHRGGRPAPETVGR